MRTTHKRLKLEDKNYDEVVKLLTETLQEFKVPDKLIGKVNAKLEPLRDDVINRSPKH